LVVPLLLFTGGCGNVFVRGAIANPSTVQGSISTVQLGTATSGTGETVQVTFVTFLQNGTASTRSFCNNQANLFPPGQTVRVNFNPGQLCSTVSIVIVIG
jgi:hypothetical protein